MINQGRFDWLDDYSGNHVFGIVLPRRTYDLFKRVRLEEIKNQIFCYIAFNLVSGGIDKADLDTSIFSAVVERAGKIAEYWSKRNPLGTMPCDRRTFNQVCEKELGVLPLDFFLLPDESDNAMEREWGLSYRYDFAVGYYYMNKSDWRRVVIEADKNERLDRSESSPEALEMWRMAFHDSKKGRPAVQRGLCGEEPKIGRVYIIRQGGTNFYKLGYTGDDDVSLRLRALQTGNPNLLSLVGEFAVSSLKGEAALHEIYRENRKCGEWFELNEEDVRNILNSEWRRRQAII